MINNFGGVRNSSPAIAGSPFGSANSGHTATLRYAQIRQSRNSYLRKTLGERAIGDDKSCCP
ncbi:MAG: hypothetical protein OD815_001600 [Candidatus Alkanophagales archaeon MCA70_species_2]|nr:hypothetical protein [Candidatus Alkanophaga liquidiphilum]